MVKRNTRKHIALLGPGFLVESTAAGHIKSLTDAGIEVIGNNVDNLTADDITNLQRRAIEGPTDIYILAHGTVINGKHYIGPERAKSGKNLIATEDLLRVLPDKVRNIHVLSCHSGFAQEHRGALVSNKARIFTYTRNTLRNQSVHGDIELIKQLATLAQSAQVTMAALSFCPQDLAYGAKKSKAPELSRLPEAALTLGELKEHMRKEHERVFLTKPRKITDEHAKDYLNNLFNELVVGRELTESEKKQLGIEGLRQLEKAEIKQLEEEYKANPELLREYVKTGQMAESIVQAAAKGRLGMLATLDRLGVDLRRKSPGDGFLAIESAIQGDHPDVVRLLIEAGADLREGEPVTRAANTGVAEIMSILADAGAEMNVSTKDGNPAVFIAASRGHTDTLRVLVNNGADPDAQSKQHDEERAIHAAAMKGNTEMVEILASAGADLSATSGRGFPAIIIAAENGYPGTVQRLVELGVDVNTRNADEGATPFMMAAFKNNPDTLRKLAELRADVNARRTSDGSTAAILAAGNGNIDTLKTLAEIGVDFELTNTRGLKPINYAKKKENIDFIEEHLKETKELYTNAINELRDKVKLLEGKLAELEDRADVDKKEVQSLQKNLEKQLRMATKSTIRRGRTALTTQQKLNRAKNADGEVKAMETHIDKVVEGLTSISSDEITIEVETASGGGAGSGGNTYFDEKSKGALPTTEKPAGLLKGREKTPPVQGLPVEFLIMLAHLVSGGRVRMADPRDTCPVPLGGLDDMWEELCANPYATGPLTDAENRALIRQHMEETAREKVQHARSAQAADRQSRALMGR